MARRQLGQHADPGAAPTPDDAGLGFAGAAEHVEQRALAASVEPDHAHPVAVAEGERQIGEERTIRSGCPESLGIDQDHDRAGYRCGPRNPESV